MSREIEEIRRKLFAGIRSGQETVFLAVVTGVNESDFTCQVRRDDLVNYFHVRLRGVINPDLDGVAFIPRVGSKVLVCRIGNSNELFVCQFTEIDKIILTNGDTAFTLDPDKIELQRADTRLRMDEEHTEFGKGEEMLFTTDGSTTTLRQGDTTLLLDGDTISLDNAGKSTINITGEEIEIRSGDSVVKWDSSGIHIEKGSSSVEVTANNAVMKSAGGTLQAGTAGIVLKGTTSLKDVLESLLQQLTLLSVSTAMGPSGPPLNAAAFTAIGTQLKACLEG